MGVKIIFREKQQYQSWFRKKNKVISGISNRTGFDIGYKVPTKIIEMTEGGKSRGQPQLWSIQEAREIVMPPGSQECTGNHRPYTTS